MAEPEQVPVSRRDDVVGAARIFRHPGQGFARARHPPAADIHFAKQQIGHDAEHRHGADNHQPGDTGGWHPVRPEHDPGHDGQRQQDAEQRVEAEQLGVEGGWHART